MNHRRKQPYSLCWLLVGLTLGSGLLTAAFANSYNEAPMLAARVAAGDLPSVEERLPQEPIVVPVLERIGDYGGTWRNALVGGADFGWLSRTVSYEPLVRVNVEWNEIIPNIAESFSVTDDGTAFTFHLREGMRWSDGHPFTADDILFWYEDVFSNETLTPLQSGFWSSGDEPVVVEKLDDTTVVFRFAEPYGFFLDYAAHSSGSIFTNYPRHYLEQFHIDYNPEGIGALVRQAGLEDWAALFENRANLWVNPDKPTLLAWRPTNAYGEGNRFVLERNPYYFKVDPEGNQLPYIDRVNYDIFEDVEVLLLRALNGEIDLMARHFNTSSNRPILADYQERGNYRFYEMLLSSTSTMLIHFNMTHEDPVKREIFQNKDFRIGLSHAINRQELIDLFFVGEAEPWQAAPFREMPFFSERLAKQYTEYNVELANDYLDRAFPERDAAGYRLGPDGRRISFAVEVVSAFNPVWGNMLELIQEDWREVGIDMQMAVMDRSLLETRRDANLHDAQVWGGDFGRRDAMLNPSHYLPYGVGSLFAVAWAQWYQGDPAGEEPPAEVKRQMALYDQLRATVDADAQAALMREVLEIAADQFYAIGISTYPPGSLYGIVKNDFRNVPEVMLDSPGFYPSPAPTNPEQYFIEGGSR